MIVGCGADNTKEDNNDTNNNENNSQNEENNEITEGPEIKGFELYKTSLDGRYDSFFYVSEMTKEEALELFINWALENGWHEDESSISSVKTFNKTGFEKLLGITCYPGYDEHEGKVEVE
jgi:hypothetical protein